ncbi:MAG: Zn-dependent protease [Planctomycetes bacterium]|nr:Zn-dependent protease [Planctomycetota bacterium]
MPQLSQNASFATVLCLASFHTSCAERSAPPPGEVGDLVELKKTIARLKPLHQKLGKPKPGDWLDQHDEPGQTFAEYLKIRPNTPTGARTVIYVQPLGDFTEKQREIVKLSAEYLGLHMNRPVKIRPNLPLKIIPAEARRVHPQWKVKQILSTYVLDKVLKPRLPKDAAAYIAFTAMDLWPGDGWNFVFGQASLRDRVGVWSIHRNGDPSGDEAEFRLCLRRTLKTATHETGHMFSMWHCTAYNCSMCGSNHLEESDRRPLYLCPECNAKVCWASKASPITRYRCLADFCQKHGLEEEQTYFERAIAVLSK